MFHQVNVILITLISCILCDTNYRLNTKVIPSEYEITITPYFDTGDKRAFTFDGQVTIKVSTAESGIKQIKIHSSNLIFSQQNITVRNKNGIVPLSPKNALEFNDTYTFAYINLESSLLPNVIYEVNIVYGGLIRDDGVGLFRSYYLEKGQTKWVAATMLQSVYARNMFPCFDEPQLKAIFILVIDRPKNYSPTLSNTKLQNVTILNNGYIRERFFPTPIMSTYLVGIVISEYSNGGYIDKGNREFGIWARPEAVNQSDFAYNFGKRVVEALGNYTDIDYYSVDNNLHLYYVSLQVFSDMGMENWGLITYKEEDLMFYPPETRPTYKFYISQVIAHETTHMWFGNLVTCHWWSDSWLNEGFAVYFQYYITSLIEPDLGSADEQVTTSTYHAYKADELHNPNPLSKIDVNSPDDIEAHFDAITYEKGGSVFRMIHHWIGDDAFKKGLQQYLKIGRFSVATPSRLYNALDTGVNSTKALAAYPGYTVTNVMSVWVNQPGHPILDVQLNTTTGKITLTQSRFYADKTFHSDEIYPIPITYTTKSAINFDNTKPAFIMAEKTRSFGNFSKDDWIIFNLQETGFYRVNYDEHLRSLIREALLGPNRNMIHHLNRAKIINDMCALKLAEKISYNQLFDMLEVMSKETDFSVWIAALYGLISLKNIMLTTPEISQLNSFILGLLEHVIQDLGFDVRANDSFVTLRNRMQIGWMACDSGHDVCIKHAVSIFRAFRDNGTRITPSLREVAYCQGLKYGTPEDYDYLFNRKITTNVLAESLEIEKILSCTRDKNKLQSFLEQMISNDYLRGDSLTSPITSVLEDPDKFQIAFDFLKKNYAALKKKIPDILSYFPDSAIYPSDLSEFEEWIKKCAICTKDEIKSTLDAITSAKTNRSWKEDRRKEIIDALKNRKIHLNLRN